jgi:hypothetical protein
VAVLKAQHDNLLLKRLVFSSPPVSGGDAAGQQTHHYFGT